MARLEVLVYLLFGKCCWLRVVRFPKSNQRISDRLSDLVHGVFSVFPEVYALTTVPGYRVCSNGIE